MTSFSATSSRGWNWLETCDDDHYDHHHHSPTTRGGRRSRALTLLEEVILPAVGSCCYTRYVSPHHPTTDGLTACVTVCLSACLTDQPISYYMLILTSNYE